MLSSFSIVMSLISPLMARAPLSVQNENRALGPDKAVEIQQTRDNALRVLNELLARCKKVGKKEYLLTRGPATWVYS
jgi:hypothetical protein